MHSSSRLFRLIPRVALLLATGATVTVSAQSNPYPLVDPGVVQTVQVPPPSIAARVDARDIEQVSGEYALSNGWRLKVEGRTSGILARIDRQRPIRLIAITREKYVSADGNVSMEFDTASDDGDMRMSYVPANSRTAQMIVVTSRMAQR